MATILVIDDEAALRGVMRRALERAGHKVVEAANGNAALAALDRRDFDLVITDVIMPERDGVETIREMRRRHSPAKILVITGGGPGKHMEYLGIAEIFGADRSLAKPFKLASLIDVVDEMLGVRKSA
jgi:DNA-binding response OmpR family regulator